MYQVDKASMKPGRNDACPCGSGKKYKHCCAQKQAAAATVSARSPNENEMGALAALLYQGNLSEAEHRARALLKAHPDAGMLWKILSIALVRQGKDALQALRRSALLLPHDFETKHWLGNALVAIGQYEAAVANYQAALKIKW